MIYEIESERTTKEEVIKHLIRRNDVVLQLFPHFEEMQGGWVEVKYINGTFKSYLTGPFGEESEQFSSQNFDLVLENAKRVMGKLVAADLRER